MATTKPNFKSEDYYEILGVSRDARETAISKTYKKLALQYHPDKNPNNKAHAEDNFKKIAEAYSVLSDAQKRKDYDQFGKDGRPGDPSGSDGSGSSGFFGGPPFSNEKAFQHFQQLFGEAFGRDGAREVHAFGDLFGNLFGSGAKRKRPRSSRGMRPPRQKRTLSCSIPAGTEVVVHDLANAPAYNGKYGKIQSFDLAKRRYIIALHDGQTVSLNMENFTQVCDVEVTGLGTKPELNGGKGVVEGYDLQTGRYVVVLKSTAALSRLKRQNCLLGIGTCVVLQNLREANLNGMMARIVNVDKDEERYTVQCENARQVRVTYDKVCY